MATTIIFESDRKGDRNRLKVDESAAEVAAAFEKSSIPQLTAGGSPVWVNGATVRILKDRSAAGGTGGGTKKTRKKG